MHCSLEIDWSAVGSVPICHSLGRDTSPAKVTTFQRAERITTVCANFTLHGRPL